MPPRRPAARRPVPPRAAAAKPPRAAAAKPPRAAAAKPPRALAVPARLHGDVKVYLGGWLEFCDAAKVDDPVDAVFNTDDYPRLEKLPQAEWTAGWFRGVADMLDVEVEAFMEWALATFAEVVEEEPAVAARSAPRRAPAARSPRRR